MNQILYTGKGKSHGPASLKSILRTFSICLIVLGIVFIGNGSYALYQNNVALKASIDNTVPEIAFEQEENNAIVKITHNRGIMRVRYHWNNDVDTIIQGNSKSSIILDAIPISQGINTLHVTAIDVNNKASESSYEFAYEGTSIDFPAFVDGTYIKISVSDVKGLSHITYKWNSEEEITAYPDGANPTIIEQLTEVPIGLNTLSVTAVNAENKISTRTKEIEGIAPPQIQTYIQDGFLIVTVTDIEGIDTISQQINVDEPYVMEANGEKEYKYKYDISNKDNVLITIKATNVRGVTKTFKGKNY